MYTLKKEDAQRREENLEKAKQIVFKQDSSLPTPVKVTTLYYIKD